MWMNWVAQQFIVDVRLVAGQTFILRGDERLQMYPKAQVQTVFRICAGVPHLLSPNIKGATVWRQPNYRSDV